MLQETKSNSTTINSLIPRLWRGSQCISVDSIGASGCLTISWNPLEVELDHFLATRCSISANFHILGTAVHRRITNVYGPQHPIQKIAFLDFLQWLVNDQPTDIDILGGDFNLITSLQDRKGGRRLLSPEDNSFKDFIGDNGLIDLQSNNDIHT